jgi:2-keto-4-pentenoate hydratase
MTTDTQVTDPQAAAEVLWQAWTNGELLEEIPESIRPADLADAYKVQLALDQHAGARVGWKLAATGAGGRTALNVEQPLAGPLYGRFQIADGATVEFGSIRMATVEAEFGLLLESTLAAGNAPHERSAVLAALGAFVPAIEIPNTRFSDHRAAGAVQLTADAALAGLFVLGDPIDDYDPEALAEHVITLTTPVATAEGTGSKVLGGPVEAVQWLANELGAHGYDLEAGQCVITGATAAVRDPGVGHVQADFGSFGSLTLELT